MYRNKIIVIFTVGIIGLLSVMIWSSNVVADNHAEQMDAGIIEPEEVGIPIQSKEDDIMLEDVSEDEETEELEDATHPDGEPVAKKVAGPTVPYEIDTTYHEPDIQPDYKRVKKVASNYTQQLLGVKPLILWNAEFFPIKVYIANPENLPERYEEGIKIGFESWQSATSDFVKFQFVQKEVDAEIVVNVIEKSEKCEENECNADYRFNIVGKTFDKVIMNIAKEECNGKALEANSVYTRVQHTLGHILGIGTHTSEALSVMNSKFTMYNSTVSTIDADTLKYLYYFVPDITNKPMSKYQKDKLLKPEDLSAVSVSEFNDKIYERLEDVKASEFDKTVEKALVMYGDGYYQRAVDTLNAALKMTEDHFEASYVYRTLALCYLRMGKKDFAIANAETAAKVLSNIKTKYFLQYIKYECGMRSEIIEDVKLLIKESPYLYQGYSLLGLIYVDLNDMNSLKELAKKAVIQFGEDRTPVKFNDLPQDTPTLEVQPSEGADVQEEDITQ